MGFKIEPFGGRQYQGDYANHTDIRQYLGLSAYAKLPKEPSPSCVWGVPLTDGRETMLQVRKGGEARRNQWGRLIKSSKHRVFALCPDCEKMVPAGRTHQHKCKA